MTENTEAPPTKLRLRDALRDNGLATTAMFLVVAVAVAGWSASFIALHAFAQQHIGLSERAAWLVPSTFDGAALALSMLSFRAAIYGRASLGSLLYVDGFTALSSWINWIHITDPQGKFVSALLPIAAVLAFGKVLKEAREAYERRHGKVVFKMRTGLLMLRWMADRSGTRSAIRNEILAIPVQALVGIGADTLARKAAEMLADKTDNDSPVAPAASQESGDNVSTGPTTTMVNPAPTTASAANGNAAPSDNRHNDRTAVAKTKPAAKADDASDSPSADKVEALIAATLDAYRQILADNTGKRSNPRPTAPELVAAVDGLNTDSRAKQIREVIERRFPELAPRLRAVESVERVS